MIKIGKAIIAILFFSCYLFSLKAQARLSVKVELSQNHVGLEDDFSYSLIVESSKSVDLKVETPHWPSGIEFSHSSRSDQTNMQIVNGQVSTNKIKTISYILKAKKLGLIQLPSIKVFEGKTLYTTKSLKLKVTKEFKSKKNRPRQGISSLNSFFNNNFNFQGQRKKENKDNIFIKLEVEKNHFFLSEQILLKWFLYSKVNISGISLDTLPVLTDFWKQEIKLNKPVPEKVRINNQVYDKIKILSYLVSPLKLGQLNIDSLKIQSQYLDSAGFGFFPQTITLVSKKKVINIKKLPENKTGKIFSGAVGDFKIKSNLKTSQVKQGKIFIWKITIQGLGNVNFFDLSKLSFDNSLELYDMQEKTKTFRSGVSEKKIEILIIPKAEGVVFLPAIDLSAFNPRTELYYNLTTEKQKLVVIADSLYLQNNILKNNTKPNLPHLNNENGKSKNQEFSVISRIKKITKKKWLPELILKKYFMLLLSLLIILSISLIYGKKFIFRKKSNLSILEKKFFDVKENILPRDRKKAARSFINLTYWSLEEYKSKKYKFLSVNNFIEELPVGYQNQYGKELKELLSYFEKVAFSPDKIIIENKVEVKAAMSLHKLLKILLKSG